MSFFQIIIDICLIINLNYVESNIILTNSEIEAKEWLKSYNSDAEKILFENVEASWSYNTNLTDYNLQISQEKDAKNAEFDKLKYKEANKFLWQNFTDPLVKREFSKIVDIGPASLPDDDFDKMTKLQGDMQRIYSTAKVCNRPNDSSGKCYPLDPDLFQIMAKSNNIKELLWAWVGWRDASGKHMPDMYEHFVQYLNKAAKINGYADNGAYWRSWYESDTFRNDCEVLWQEIKPLYEQLHAYTRRNLKKKYPELNFPSQGHIPAHLLGNMWAQSWENIENILRPSPSTPGMDITDELIKQGCNYMIFINNDTNYTALKMFRVSDDFFKSLNLKPMPQPFWDKSMIVKPSDRDVVCHASAWDFFNKKDFRIKQCTEVDMKWFFTTHHEMGHVEYYLQYLDQPIKFRQGANPGFHEAIADIASLSISTPEYMQSVGLLPNFVDDLNGDLNFLMQQALSKIAFIPFGYMIDQWRWDLFSGNITRSNYNKRWWDVRCKYQGVSPPIARSEKDFDAGSKFHVPNNTPYIRYFVAHIIQFQFHEALCKVANNKRPLHRCDISNSKEAGKKLEQLMKSGASKPWPEILKELTGSDKMSASSLVKYFRPLLDWLNKLNEGHTIGWEDACPRIFSI